jgi:hypothetical protein
LLEHNVKLEALKAVVLKAGLQAIFLPNLNKGDWLPVSQCWSGDLLTEDLMAQQAASIGVENKHTPWHLPHTNNKALRAVEQHVPCRQYISS